MFDKLEERGDDKSNSTTSRGKIQKIPELIAVIPH